MGWRPCEPTLSGAALSWSTCGLADSTIRNDTNHLELIRAWFGGPLWELPPADADAYSARYCATPSRHAHRAGGGADGVLPEVGAAPQGHLPVSPRGKGWESVCLPPVVGGASRWSMRMSFSHCSYRWGGQPRSATSVR